MVALAAIALAACGGSQAGGHAGSKAPQASTQSIDACSLFTQQDARALLGAAVTKQADQANLQGTGDYSSTCYYTMTGGSFDNVNAARRVRASRVDDT